MLLPRPTCSSSLLTTREPLTRCLPCPRRGTTSARRRQVPQRLLGDTALLPVALDDPDGSLRAQHRRAQERPARRPRCDDLLRPPASSRRLSDRPRRQAPQQLARDEDASIFRSLGAWRNPLPRSHVQRERHHRVRPRLYDPGANEVLAPLPSPFRGEGLLSALALVRRTSRSPPPLDRRRALRDAPCRAGPEPSGVRAGSLRQAAVLQQHQLLARTSRE